MTATRFLVDASAIASYADAKVAAQLDDLAMAGLAVSCGVVELQLLGAVADTATRARVAALRAVAFEVLDTSAADFGRAAQVQTVLAESGEFGIAWPALVIAAIAERHEVTLLHRNPHHEVIGKVTGQAEQCAGAGDQAGT
jgi:predicted nucleic acid-binding protein